MVLVVVLQLLIAALAGARTAEQRGLALIVGASTLVEYQAGALKATSGQYPPLGQPQFFWHINENEGSLAGLDVRVSWKERRQDAEVTMQSSFIRPKL
jgi:hypothetical protein